MAPHEVKNSMSVSRWYWQATLLRPQRMPNVIARLRVSPNARRKDFGRVRLPSRGNGRSGRAALKKNVHEHRFARKNTPRYGLAEIASTFAQVKQCKALDIAIVSVGRETAPFRLPYSQSFVGDPESGIVHGGGVSALLEHTAIIKS